MNDINLELFKNVTAKTIYYSCIAKSMTIPEISEQWDYSSASYFYQIGTKLLINTMEEKGLISFQMGRGGGISSNYDFFLSNEVINSFFKKLNFELTKTFIEFYDYDMKTEHLEDSKYLNYIIDELQIKEKVNDFVYSVDDVKQFKLLWEHNSFVQTFLSADFIKALFKTRRRLPSNPLEFTYGLTIELCDDLSKYMKENNVNTLDFSWILNPYESMWLDDESYDKLCTFETSHLKNTRHRIESITKICNEKIKSIPIQIEEERPHLAKFVKKVGYWSNE